MPDTANPTTTDNIQRTKLCRRCKKPTLMRDFQTPRHKWCIPCQIKVRRLSTWQPAQVAPRMPGITRTREGLNKLDRERKRLAAPERKPPMRVASHKLCRRCQLVKPYSEFSSWRVRVCLACDGPPLLRG